MIIARQADPDLRTEYVLWHYENILGITRFHDYVIIYMPTETVNVHTAQLVAVAAEQSLTATFGNIPRHHLGQPGQKTEKGFLRASASVICIEDSLLIPTEFENFDVFKTAVAIALIAENKVPFHKNCRTSLK